jgi:HD-GYP domain-containing protein (c-di-GMP phosphodiesterase class II)
MLKSSADYPKEILEACLHHHERWDGAGYPFGLEAEAIPLFARMCAICDAYDAITSNRSYRSGWDPGESIAQMASWTGQFDQELFNTFVRSMGIFPTGSLVRLQSQKLAVVVDQNPHSQTTPVVKVFYSLRSQMHIPPERVDLGHPSCRDRIVSREPAAEWSKLGLDSLWAGSDVRRR